MLFTSNGLHGHGEWEPGQRSGIWNRKSLIMCIMSCNIISSTGLVPRHSQIGEECLVSTVHGCVAPRVSLGNLETIVILVRVARHCITESRESLHLDAALFIQQSLSVALCKVGKPGMAPTEVKMMAIQHVYNGKDVLV